MQESCEFILHRQDLEFFCRFMMGDFKSSIGTTLARATHTLDLHSPPTYGQHEFSSIDAAQTMVLQQYRQTLRNLKHFFIRGPSIGWETGLYGAALQEIRSIDDREPTELIDDIRALEQKGSQVFLRTGDFEAADPFWAEAYRKCGVAGSTSWLSRNPKYQDDDLSKAWTTYIQRWTQLRRQYGDECAVPYFELKFKLTRHRLSGLLRFLEEGHHLTPRHGLEPKNKYRYLNFVSFFFLNLNGMRESPLAWSPRPADEAQLCLTQAAIFRLLNAMPREYKSSREFEGREAMEAYRAVRRASELLPNDEAIQQERGRVETWMRSLVDEGKLESIPSFESLTGPHWSWDSKAL